MKVFVTRPIPRVGVDLLKKAGHKVTVQPEQKNLSQRELKEALKGKKYDAILSFLTNQIDEDVLKSAGDQLKVVANFAVGFDNVDVKTANARGVVVANTPCIEVSRSVAEHTFALMLSLARRIPEADVFARAKKYKGWDPDLLIGNDIYETTLGIVGLGGIGKEVAKRAAKGFDMKILYTDVKPDREFEKEYNAKYMKLEDLLPLADIVTLHVPLLPSTRHLITTKTLKLMKKNALLINTARGPVVDEKAVLKALYAKKLGGFALDVFECEPAIDCDLTDHYELRALPNVIMTPHIASATVRARDAMATLAAQAIIDVATGKEPKTVVKMK